MVPVDYRLEAVAARVIERLEGARRSFADRPRKALREFERLAGEQVDAAVAEYREVSLVGDPERHAAFLRHEILDTFLPRYLRLAMVMTDQERRNFGLGPLAEPLGRVGLGILALTIVVCTLRTPLGWAWWLVMGALLLLPFLPDLVAMMYRTRYRRELLGLLEDMARIQRQVEAYVPPEQLSVDDPPRKPPEADPS